jgi:hypothetical protein
MATRAGSKSHGSKTRNLENLLACAGNCYSETLTFSDCDGTNPSFVIHCLLQLRPLILPQGLLIFLGQVGEELQEIGQKLSFIRIIQVSLGLAFVRLFLVVDGERLVTNCSDGTDFSFPDVEDLWSSGSNVFEPPLPSVGNLVELGIWLFLEGFDASVDCPNKLPSKTIVRIYLCTTRSPLPII